MIKPARLRRGDRVAIVSLSWGGIGDEALIHKYHLGKKRLEEEFGLEVMVMPHALKGTAFVYDHPELRAADWMAAFSDPTIRGIFCAIGGSDTIRIAPYVDYQIIQDNPKIFMGFSDTTANHFMMQKAGVVSFYGPCLMQDFAEYGHMFDYTKQAVQRILFDGEENFDMLSSDLWSDDEVPWKEENMGVVRKVKPETRGYELLQGGGRVTGKLLGGCLDGFPIYVGTPVWPTLEEWQDKVLFLETSEDHPSPDLIRFYLMNLGAQGIFDAVQGIIVGKPQFEKYYEEYKEVYRKVLRDFGQPDLPVLYNVNFGHAVPIGILPMGTDVDIDFDRKRIVFAERPVE